MLLIKSTKMQTIINKSDECHICLNVYKIENSFYLMYSNIAIIYRNKT